MAKILFLDIDGVCNSAEFFRKIGRVNGPDLWEMLDEQAVRLLDGLIQRTGAVVVISSSWRLFFDFKDIIRALRKRGFRGEIVGCTSYLSERPRGEEIARWLKSNPCERFAIVDDARDMGELLPYLVRTTWERGLTEADVEKLYQLLTGGENHGKEEGCENRNSEGHSSEEA